jgi:hypothetical protein
MLSQRDNLHWTPGWFGNPYHIFKKMFDVALSGVDFSNILLTAFICADPKSTKNTVKPSVFFALLGSVLVKTAPKMLAKSTCQKRTSSLARGCCRWGNRCTTWERGTRFREAWNLHWRNPGMIYVLLRVSECVWVWEGGGKSVCVSVRGRIKVCVRGNVKECASEKSCSSKKKNANKWIAEKWRSERNR